MRPSSTKSGVTSAMSVVTATRRMKVSAASTIPTSTAIVRSAKTVSANVDDPDGDVGPGQPQQLRDLVPLAHVPRHHQQDRGEHRHRDEPRQRRRGQQHDEQRDGVHHAGDRRARAGADVGRGARDGARGRQAAEQRRRDVGDALRDELDVRVVVIAPHAVGDHRRQQRLDRAEQRHGQRRPEQRRDQLRPEVPGRRRAAGRTECRRSGCRPSRRRRRAIITGRGAADERDDRAGTPRRDAPQHDHERQRGRAERRAAGGENVPACRASAAIRARELRRDAARSAARRSRAAACWR